MTRRSSLALLVLALGACGLLRRPEVLEPDSGVDAGPDDAGFDAGGRSDSGVRPAPDFDIVPLVGDAGPFPTELVAADLSGDGRPDLAIMNANSVRVFINDAGSFGPAPVWGGPRTAGTGELAASDVDGDGRVDLFATHGASGSVGAWLNLGGGAFSAEVRSFVSVKPRGVVLFGPGRDAVVASPDTDELQPLRNLGGGSFAGGPTRSGGHGPTGIVAADFDRDGLTDLALANASGEALSLLLGLPDGGFGARTALAAAATTVPQRILAADLDRDGDADLVYSALQGNVQVRLNLGDAGFAPPTVSGTGTTPFGLAAGDFNCDGRVDLVVVNVTDDLSFLLGRGDGTFEPQRRLGAVNQVPTSLAAVDLDGDTVLDLVVGGNTGVTLWHNRCGP